MGDKKCFIVTPIGEERTEERDSLDGLLEEVLYPTLINKGFKQGNITVAHKIPDAGSINRQIITRIVEDDLNIVNLTGLNPNVMYELAIRHAVGKPVIIIAENGTKLPFDIIDQRTIFYSDTMLGASGLKKNLKSAIDSFEDLSTGLPVDNPVIKIIQENSILNQLKEGQSENPAFDIILRRLDGLERKSSYNNERRIKDNKNKVESMEQYVYNNIDFSNLIKKDDIYTKIGDILRSIGIEDATLNAIYSIEILENLIQKKEIFLVNEGYSNEGYSKLPF